jgi:hypothetical protein
MKTNSYPTIVVNARNLQSASTVREIITRLARRYFGVEPKFTGNGRNLNASIIPTSKYRCKTTNVLCMNDHLSEYFGDDASVSVQGATFTVAPSGDELHIKW